MGKLLELLTKTRLDIKSTMMLHLKLFIGK